MEPVVQIEQKLSQVAREIHELKWLLMHSLVRNNEHNDACAGCRQATQVVDDFIRRQNGGK